MVGTAEQINLSGERLAKVDALPKVTGTAEFGADIDLPGLQQAKVLRSPHAHANIKSIDTTAAEALSHEPSSREVATYYVRWMNELGENRENEK